MTTTLDIRHYLLSNSPWVNFENTVDTVKIGDPSKPVIRAGVCWYPAIDTIRAALADACDLLITHEPTFWEHAAPEQQWRTKAPGIAKRELLEKSGMVVLRVHDSWDNWPDIGIRDAWARGLGLTRRIKEGSLLRWHALYEVEPQTLRQFARYVAARIAPLAEDAAQVMGDPDRIVSRPSLGVGCACPDAEMVEAGSDVCIVCYDGAGYWNVRERLVEMGAAVITVEHGTSEMWGLESLRDHLAQTFPNVEFRYYAEHPRTWTVRAAE